MSNAGIPGYGPINKQPENESVAVPVPTEAEPTSTTSTDHVRVIVKVFGFSLCIWAGNVSADVAGEIAAGVALLASHGLPVSVQTS